MVVNAAMEEYRYTQNFDYELPEERIAEFPLETRDESRLLVVDRKTGELTDAIFKDLPEFLNPSDFLVMNNSKVFAARFLGHRLIENSERGGKAEIFLLKDLGGGDWEGLVRTTSKKRPGMKFLFENEQESIRAVLKVAPDAENNGVAIVNFDKDPRLTSLGCMPLPPYIKRDAVKSDLNRYQTVYAKTLGSSAAPTAGLHFTNVLFDRLAEKGIRTEELTLHVGLGTFKPVTCDDVLMHEMHVEDFSIESSLIEKVKNRTSRCVAVGTTSLRALESAFLGDSPRNGFQSTKIFIHPTSGHCFKAVDALITNFHLPKSTLIMLVSAFATPELIKKAYQHAIDKKYRFFSYGDAMLLL